MAFELPRNITGLGRRWPALVAGLFVLLALVPLQAFAANPSADLDQCANGNPIENPACPATDPGDSDWVNGNLNSSKSMYLEGDSVPYRMRFDDLSIGAHAVTIEWDTTKAGKHALDYLTSFDRTVGSANPCAGVGGCASSTTFAIPADPQVTGGGVTPVSGSFRLFGGTITSVSPYSYPDGTGFAGDKSASVTVSFTASVANPVLAWGGHIASRQDWGNTNSAVTIPGSPYHMRLIDLDGAGGNQDRSLSNDAVIFPASITITKDAVPNHAQDFAYTTTGGLSPAGFTLDDDGDAALPNTHGYNGIATFGTYTVSESAVGGWAVSFADPPCTVTSANGGSQSVNGSTVSITLKEGENVSCTFTNTREQGSIELKKVWDGTPGDTTLKIGTSAGGSQTASKLVEGQNDSTGAKDVDTGTYYVSETDPGDYDSALECTKNGDELEPGANGSVAVGAEDSVVCTFTNTRQQGSIELVKDWDGTPGDTTLKIGTSAGGAQIDSEAVSGANETTGANAVDTGTYYVSETDPGDYDSSLECLNGESGVSVGQDGAVAVADDDAIVCTFTNTRQQGSIELKKVWSGTAGSTTLRIGSSSGGSQVDSQAVSGANGTTGANAVDTGTYFVSETDPGDYDSSLDCLNGESEVSVGQDGSVAVGDDDTIVCTFTNTRQQGSIELKKVWEGTAGNTTLRIGSSSGGSQVDSQAVSGANGTTGANAVDTGTYFVSETDPGDYDTALECTYGESEVSVGQDGSVAVGDDDTIVCTFTNTRQQGSIELVKDWDGTPGDTTLKIGTSAGGDQVDFEAVSGANETTGTNVVDTGTYYVSETDPGPYDSSLQCLNGETEVGVGEDGSVDVGDDDTVVCTFTNARQQGSIELQKVWSGTAGETTLNIGTQAGGGQVDSQAVSGENGTTGANIVDTGTYYVSETDPGPYDSSLQCSDGGSSVDVGETGAIVVGDDANVVCTFTNTRQQGSIELAKVWSGTPGETVLSIGTTAGGDDIDTAEVSGANGTTGANTVDTGTYFVSETDLDDYDSALQCTDGEAVVEVGDDGAVNVGDDADVVCTFTNTRQQGSIELTKAWDGIPGQTTLSIGTSAGGADVDTQQTGAAGAEPLTTGPNAVDTGTYYLSETNPGAYDSVLSCLSGEEVVIAQEDGSVEVGDDETIVCTFTNSSRPSAIEVRKVADPVSVSPGQTVTFTYEVENTGETTLEDVTVDDNVLGLIGTIDSLEPGEIVTLEKTMTAEEDSPTENIVTACGTDPYDEEVCDDDLERIQILLPAGPRERPNLPRTGFNLLGYLAIGLNLIAVGSVMMLHRRRFAR